MVHTLLTFVHRITNRWSLSVVAGVTFMFMWFLVPAVYGQLTPEGSSCRALDTYLYYTPEKAREILGCFGLSLRTYLLAELTLDLVYPLVYTLFFIMLLTALLKGIKAGSGPFKLKDIQYLSLLPIFGWLFDLLENVSISIMITRFPKIPDWLAITASASTLMKWICIAANVVSVFVLVIVLIRRGLKG